jgi:hypothetical protein
MAEFGYCSNEDLRTMADVATQFDLAGESTLAKREKLGSCSCVVASSRRLLLGKPRGKAEFHLEQTLITRHTEFDWDRSHRVCHRAAGKNSALV